MVSSRGLKKVTSIVAVHFMKRRLKTHDIDIKPTTTDGTLQLQDGRKKNVNMANFPRGAGASFIEYITHGHLNTYPDKIEVDELISLFGENYLQRETPKSS